MRKLGGLILALGLSAAAMAGPKPLASVSKFDGKFFWVKAGTLPADAAKSLTFPHNVAVKGDKAGNHWFTLVIADQGSDWVWHQTTAGALIPVSGGVVKAGKYTVSVPINGIPKSVLADKQQTISIGPGTSGLASPTSFTIDRLRGK